MKRGGRRGAIASSDQSRAGRRRLKENENKPKKKRKKVLDGKREGVLLLKKSKMQTHTYTMRPP